MVQLNFVSLRQDCWVRRQIRFHLLFATLAVGAFMMRLRRLLSSAWTLQDLFTSMMRTRQCYDGTGTPISHQRRATYCFVRRMAAQ